VQFNTLSAQSAEFQKSRMYLNKLDEIVENFPSAIFKIPYLLAKQAYLFESGRYDENVKVLIEIVKTASSMNHKNYLYLSYRLLSDTYFHMEDYERAQIYYEYAFACLDKENDNELEKIELAVVKSLIRGRFEKEDDTVESILLLAKDYYEKEELHYSRTQICFHLADYYYEKGLIKESMNYFKECLKESKERRFISHILRSMERSKRLFNYTLSNKIEEEFINKLKILKSELHD
jgi:tetratricopeptide (TPR) repeat protein